MIPEAYEGVSGCFKGFKGISEYFTGVKLLQRDFFNGSFEGFICDFQGDSKVVPKRFKTFHGISEGFTYFQVRFKGVSKELQDVSNRLC